MVPAFYHVHRNFGKISSPFRYGPECAAHTAGRKAIQGEGMMRSGNGPAGPQSNALPAPGRPPPALHEHPNGGQRSKLPRGGIIQKLIRAFTPAPPFGPVSTPP